MLPVLASIPRCWAGFAVTSLKAAHRGIPSCFRAKDGSDSDGGDGANFHGQKLFRWFVGLGMDDAVWNRRTARGRIQLVELRIQPLEHTIGQRANLTQRVILRDMLLQLK
jgi:hypothetical protein